jgi:outer membrane lipoprotein-sorting protein
MLSKDYEYSVVKKETDMKTTRPISLLVLLLLLGTWFLPACAAPQAPAMAPEEVITRSEDAMKTVNSYQLKMGIKISVSGVNMDMTIEGAYEAPDRMYMKMNIPLSGEVEIYMKDANTVYAKGSTFGTEWTKIDASQFSGSSFAPSPTQFLDIAKDLTMASVENVGGTTCYHIKANIASDKLSSILSSAGLGGQASIKDVPFDIWVGSQDFYVYKIAMKMEMSVSGQNANADLTLEFWNYGKTYSFPNP